MGRPRKNLDQILVAKESGVVVLDGQEVVVHKNITRARAGHAIVKAAPDLWEPIKVHYDVEQATAAPGERRGA